MGVLILKGYLLVRGILAEETTHLGEPFVVFIARTARPAQKCDLSRQMLVRKTQHPWRGCLARLPCRHLLQNVITKLPLVFQCMKKGGIHLSWTQSSQSFLIISRQVSKITGRSCPVEVPVALSWVEKMFRFRLDTYFLDKDVRW